MEFQAIVIDESEKKKELSKLQENTGAKSHPEGASSSHAKPIEEIPKKNEIQKQQEPDQEEEESLQHSLNLIQRRLDEKRRLQGEGKGSSSSICIHKFPQSLVGINDKAQQPEIVSIGPYHRGKVHLLEFEQHKWSFLDKLLSRTSNIGRSLSIYLKEMRSLEVSTRQSYADTILMSSHDFVEMMLLDGCFVIELLRHLGNSEEVFNEDDPIFTRPWLIPILIRDLLKLENQLPMFLLRKLFLWSMTSRDIAKDYNLPLLALKVFDLAFPRPLLDTVSHRYFQGEHLLDLFYSTLLPLNRAEDLKDRHCKGNSLLNLFSAALLPLKKGRIEEDLEEYLYRPSNQSIQCVTQLRPSGIKFQRRKTWSLLEIKFQNSVLEIPTITINDFTSTLLVNCVVWEQCHEVRSKYFTDYVAFMNCLINQPRDVAFLCMDGIISKFSQDDLHVANLFKNLGQNVEFNIRKCYLSKQFREVEAQYSSNWATMMRTYFSSPWSFISVFSAFIIIALTIVQTILSILSYKTQTG